MDLGSGITFDIFTHVFTGCVFCFEFINIYKKDVNVQRTISKMDITTSYLQKKYIRKQKLNNMYIYGDTTISYKFADERYNVAPCSKCVKSFVTSKIVKMGYKENLNLKTRCLWPVFVLCSGPHHQACVKLSMMLLP